MMLIIAISKFSLILTCEYKFIKYWLHPKQLENKEGLIFGMTCAIAFDIISLTYLFVLFYVVVNQNLEKMMHLFYNGVPPFCFEVAIQCFFKKKLMKYYKQAVETDNHERQITMLARIKIKEEQEEKRIRRINEINKLKEFKFSRSQKTLAGRARNPPDRAQSQQQIL
mmetsp:Transcript_2397/g.3667  ORF Transcript_2397/g.3667 Transcript_2397/m.3667 type:complete len:168 (+) Transcript_2397:472-975(+)